jgi:hypothetical protein
MTWILVIAQVYQPVKGRRHSVGLELAKWPPALYQEMACIFKMAACIWSRDGLHFQNGRLHLVKRWPAFSKWPPAFSQEMACIFKMAACI